MKTISTLALLIFSQLPAAAMVFGDSRIVTVKELAPEGIEVEVRRSGRPTEGVFVSVQVFAIDKKYQSMAFSVLDREIDDDFRSNDAKKIGVRDSKRWAKEVRGIQTKEKTMVFSLFPGEAPRSYVVLNFNLPSKDGIPVFGTYYLLMSKAEKETKK